LESEAMVTWLLRSPPLGRNKRECADRRRHVEGAF
jgi:hypothetical protein